VVKNFAEVRTTLQYFISSETGDAEKSIKAAGLLAAISKRQFIFAKEVNNLILNLLAPADNILQQRSTSLAEGYDVINSNITEIGNYETMQSFKK